MKEAIKERLTPEQTAVLRDIHQAMEVSDTEVHLVSGMDATVPAWAKKVLADLLGAMLAWEPPKEPRYTQTERSLRADGVTWRVKADVRGGGVSLLRDGKTVAAADLGRASGELEETARRLILRRLLDSCVIF